MKIQPILLVSGFMMSIFSASAIAADQAGKMSLPTSSLELPVKSSSNAIEVQNVKKPDATEVTECTKKLKAIVEKLYPDNFGPAPSLKQVEVGIALKCCKIVLPAALAYENNPKDDLLSFKLNCAAKRLDIYMGRPSISKTGIIETQPVK